VGGGKFEADSCRPSGAAQASDPSLGSAFEALAAQQRLGAFLETTSALGASWTLVRHRKWYEASEKYVVRDWESQQHPNPDGCLLRLPQNPVMNSPVVSVAVFHGRNFLRGVLESPISLEFRLLQTANRSKAICVQWDPPGP
jgi:hypothetical protein